LHPQFSPISGGISNILVKVAPNNPQLAPVAVKVFGEKTELLIDREAERHVVVDLSTQGFGPKVGGALDTSSSNSSIKGAFHSSLPPSLPPFLPSSLPPFLPFYMEPAAVAVAMRTISSRVVFVAAVCSTTVVNLTRAATAQEWQL
jgi:ethanolamine kinase